MNTLEKIMAMTDIISTGYSKLQATPSTLRLYFTLKSLDTSCLIRNPYFFRDSMILRIAFISSSSEKGILLMLYYII